MTTTYKTVREAAIAGTLQAMRLAERDGWEYGGVVVLQSDGTYGVSEIVTSQDPHGVNLAWAYPAEFRDDAGVGIPRAKFDAFRKVVQGFFHVHQDGERDMFSGQDVESAVRIRALAYMGDTRTGRIFEIDARSLPAFTESVQRLEPDEHGLEQGGISQSFAAEGRLVYGPEALARAA